MRRFRVSDIIKYEIDPRSKKTKRIVLKIEYIGAFFYLDVTDELKTRGVEYEYSIGKLRAAVPEEISASVYETSFRISDESMDLWLIQLLAA